MRSPTVTSDAAPESTVTDGTSAHSVPTVRIRPITGFVLPDLKELWQYRHVLSALVWRNVARRYRQTLLGPIWFIISPLVRMVLFSLVLGKLAGLPSEGVPYPIFTYTALLPWELFASGISRSTSCFVTYQHIISKLYFPRLLVPMAEVLTALVDFALSFVILLAMVLIYGYPLTIHLLVIPLLLLLTMGLALSVGLLTAALQARYRDVSKFVSYIVQFWFYGTPVAYSATLVEGKLPEALKWLYMLNPMNGVVEGFRWAVLGTGRPPDLALLVSAGFILVMLVIASVVFLRTEHSIVDLV
jgi:lipopolysaccharide transport system permease protein